jgi:hypothetical protein
MRCDALLSFCINNILAPHHIPIITPSTLLRSILDTYQGAKVSVHPNKKLPYHQRLTIETSVSAWRAVRRSPSLYLFLWRLEIGLEMQVRSPYLLVQKRDRKVLRGDQSLMLLRSCCFSRSTYASPKPTRME